MSNPCTCLELLIDGLGCSGCRFTRSLSPVSCGETYTGLDRPNLRRERSLLQVKRESLQMGIEITLAIAQCKVMYICGSS